MIPDRLARRSSLAVRPNPDAKLEYLVTLEGRIGAVPPVLVTVRYVPDRQVLVPESLDAYLAGLAEAGWETLEALGVALLDDLRNELVARWLEVVAERQGPAGLQRVLLEDRQPKWDNPTLLARLPR